MNFSLIFYPPSKFVRNLHVAGLGHPHCLDCSEMALSQACDKNAHSSIHLFLWTAYF